MTDCAECEGYDEPISKTNHYYDKHEDVLWDLIQKHESEKIEKNLVKKREHMIVKQSIDRCKMIREKSISKEASVMIVREDDPRNAMDVIEDAARTGYKRIRIIPVPKEES